MSLRHALLAVLTADPMTGYDLVRQFDSSIAFVWSAPKSQVYPELRRMETDELVDSTEVPRGQHAVKRVYSITDAGRIELERWMTEEVTIDPTRDPLKLRAAYFEMTDMNVAQGHLERHLAECQGRRIQWTAKLREIEQRRLPILAKRLAKISDENEAQRVVDFKLFAYRGELGRLDAEIVWAKAGLDLLARHAGVSGARAAIKATTRR